MPCINTLASFLKTLNFAENLKFADTNQRAGLSFKVCSEVVDAKFQALRHRRGVTDFKNSRKQRLRKVHDLGGPGEN